MPGASQTHRQLNGANLGLGEPRPRYGERLRDLLHCDEHAKDMDGLHTGYGERDAWSLNGGRTCGWVDAVCDD
jgi:hypothetical protein